MSGSAGGRGGSGQLGLGHGVGFGCGLGTGVGVGVRGGGIWAFAVAETKADNINKTKVIRRCVMVILRLVSRASSRHELAPAR